jgi:O-antigen ligase
MAIRRLSAGQTITHINGEVVGVLALGAVVVLTIPFSFWPGGSLKLFSDVYVKIILIFALMISTITSPRRVRQMTWIMIVASGYLASRAVFDYVRGVNLVEGDRVRGAVGGMFENPNDLALNLVTFLAPTLFIIFQDRRLSRRLLATAIAGAMLAAIICTKSRSGFLGLIAMGAVALYYVAKVKPAIVMAALVAGLMALPAMPESFWNRMDSIMNADEDASGSRAARLRLIEQGVEVFLTNPVTGIGAGQFQNYNPPGTIERWRVTHNVWLQVAAELGVFGVAAFAFLVVRAYAASFVALRMLRRSRKQRNPQSPIRDRRSAVRTPESSLTNDERRLLEINAKGMIAAMVGWTVCSLFASVAFNWTFYYVLALAVAGREIVVSRGSAADAAPTTAPAARLVRATA